jgi:hypothetical protein
LLIVQSEEKAPDDAAVGQFLDAAKAGRGGEAYLVGELRVGQVRVLLQGCEDLPVDFIKMFQRSSSVAIVMLNNAFVESIIALLTIFEPSSQSRISLKFLQSEYE